QWQFSHRRWFRTSLKSLLDFKTNLTQIDVENLQNIGGDAVPLLHQSQQQMLRADVVVIQALGFLIGQTHYVPREISKSFVHRRCRLEIGRITLAVSCEKAVSGVGYSFRLRGPSRSLRARRG